MAPVDFATIDVVILCGGQGTRLGSLTQQTPKPLLAVAGEPFLCHLLRRLQHEGFQRFVLAAHYLADAFHHFIRAYREEFPAVTLVIEPAPLGTGGALRHVAPHVRSSTFIAMNGDSFVPQSMQAVLAYHTEYHSPFTMVAVRAARVEGGIADKGGMQIGPAGEVLMFSGHRASHETWVNGGIYVTERQTVMRWREGSYNLENALESLLKPDRAQAFLSDAPLLDIGTPKTYAAAQDHGARLVSLKDRL